MKNQTVETKETEIKAKQDSQAFEFFTTGIGIDEDTAFQMVMAQKPAKKKINGYKEFAKLLA